MGGNTIDAVIDGEETSLEKLQIARMEIKLYGTRK